MTPSSALAGSGDIYGSTDLGPYWQNPFLALLTSRIGDKKVLFPIPHYTKQDVVLTVSHDRTA